MTSHQNKTRSLLVAMKVKVSQTMITSLATNF